MILNTKSPLLKLSMTALFLTGCGIRTSEPKAEVIHQENLSSGFSSLAVNVNQYPSNKIICDPLSGGNTTQTNYEKGIVASLYYLTTGMPIMKKSTDYAQFAHKSDQNIFLSDMNVPTRMFTEGFATSTGTFLKNDQEQKLIEYFGLKMNTNLVLSAADTAGNYELALLSDDGTTLKLKSGTDEIADEVLIDNDGDHPTKMGCSSRVVRMRHNVMLPIEVTYYQGPRYHISNVLIWRKATTAGQDSLCNQLGNDKFFNPNKNSEPQQAFRDLEARGWKVLTPDNFMVSRTTNQYNPCVKGSDPIITELAMGEVILTDASLSWKTDILATSHVQLTNMTTGEVTITQSDNVLRTTHDLKLSGLQSGTTYKAQAVSVSEDLGRTTSTELTFTTQ